MGRSTTFVVAPRKVHFAQAAIVLITSAPAWIVVAVVHGYARYLVAAIVLALVFALTNRAFRLALIVTLESVQIRNYWRTYDFAWSDVEGVGPGSVMATTAIAFVLRDGTVRCAQATCYGRITRRDVQEKLVLYAPPRVRFITEKPSGLMAIPMLRSAFDDDDATVTGDYHGDPSPSLGASDPQGRDQREHS